MSLRKYQDKLNGYSQKYQDKRGDSSFMKYGFDGTPNNAQATRPPPIPIRTLDKVADPRQWAPPPKKGGDPLGPYKPQFAQPTPGQPVPGQLPGYGQPVQAPAAPGVAQPPVYAQVPGQPPIAAQPAYGAPAGQPVAQPVYAQPPPVAAQPVQHVYAQPVPQPAVAHQVAQPAAQPIAQPVAQPAAKLPAGKAGAQPQQPEPKPLPPKRPIVDPHSFAPPPPSRAGAPQEVRPHISRRPDRSASSSASTTPSTSTTSLARPLPTPDRPPAYAASGPIPPARAVPATPAGPTPPPPTAVASPAPGAVRPPKPKPAKPKPALNTTGSSSSLASNTSAAGSAAGSAAAPGSHAMPDIGALRNRMAAMGLREVAPEPVAEPLEDYSQPTAGHAIEPPAPVVAPTAAPSKPKPAKPGKPKPALKPAASERPLPAQPGAAAAAPAAAPVPAPAPSSIHSRPPPVAPSRPSVPFSRAAATPPAAGPPTDDLELHTLWFTAPMDQLRLPSAFAGRSYTCQGAANSQRETLAISIREPDLRVLRIGLEWPSNDPRSVQVDRKVGFPPRPLNNTELVQYHGTYGESVATWSEQQIGRRVGDGECWTLAKEALSSAGALPSQGYVHGAQVLYQEGSQVQHSYDMMRRGDILQFESAKFSTGATGPHHTSIVCSVDHSVVHVVEQNVQGSPVKRGQYDLQTMSAGKVVVYRPVSEDWIEPL